MNINKILKTKIILKRYAKIIALTLVFPCHPAWAANDAGLPGEFLNFGAGARPMAMGGAFTGVADDVDSIYWNPAGLATYRSSQISLEQAPLPLGGAFQYAAYSQPIYTLGTLGIGIVNLNSGNVPRVLDNVNFAESGSFSDQETGYLASYAQRFGDQFSLAGTAKMAEQSIDGQTVHGFGGDVGALYSVNDQVRLGAMVRNIVRPTYNFSTDQETFPAIARAGASVKLFKDHLLTDLDLEKTVGTPQNPKWNFGVEGHVLDPIYLRAGINQTEITAGIGIQWKTIHFDYAAEFQDIGFLNRFSIKFFFGGYEVDVKASPDVFSPVGFKNKTTLHINVRNRSRVINWILSIRNAKGNVVRSFQGFNAPPFELEWDGKDDQGRLVEAGDYTYRMSVTDNKNHTEVTPVRSMKIEAPTPMEIEAK